MSISPLQNNYLSTKYGQKSSTENLSSNTEAKNTEEVKNNSQKTQKNNNYLSSNSKNWLQQIVSATMDGMGLGPTDKVSFSTIIAYKNELQEDFDTKVKEGLKKTGLNENLKFQLVSGEEGGIKVVADSPDKEKIEKFFEDNPKLVKQFEKIQALNNIEESRKQQGIDVSAIQQRIQVESMAAWYSNSGAGGVSSIMDFSGGQTSFLSGINKRI